MAREYPDVKLAGLYAPPFRSLSPEEDKTLVAEINASGAGIVFVALGCPKQEKWMSKHQGQINAVMLGIGWAFVVFAGLEKRSPKWMQTYSLEWLYRLAREPKRLLKRYGYTNTLFLLLIFKQALQQLKNSR